MQRRDFLRSALASGLVLAGARPELFSATAFAREKVRRFSPVKVSPDRRIRTVVGLRPYRPSGFVVSAEKIGGKLLVHNYGHGGAGMTLSWGTAHLALEESRAFERPASKTRYAVIGCGVSGLSTARLLQRRGGLVTIYAKALAPETTSNKSGALWLPTSVFNQSQISAKFAEQFRSACLISQRSFKRLVSPQYGVRWIETYELLSGEESLEFEMPGGADLYARMAILNDPKRYFGSEYVRRYSTMLIEPRTYLGALVRDFYRAGGKIVVKEFKSLDEIATLLEPVVFNCTGLGAKSLFNDSEMIPVRGQLEVLLPQREVDYCYLGLAGYMFPRRDGIVLGGTWDRDNWSLEPNPEQGAQILANHAEVMRNVK